MAYDESRCPDCGHAMWEHTARGRALGAPGCCAPLYPAEDGYVCECSREQEEKS